MAMMAVKDLVLEIPRLQKIFLNRGASFGPYPDLDLLLLPLMDDLTDDPFVLDRLLECHDYQHHLHNRLLVNSPTWLMNVTHCELYGSVKAASYLEDTSALIELADVLEIEPLRFKRAGLWNLIRSKLRASNYSASKNKGVCGLCKLPWTIPPNCIPRTRLHCCGVQVHVTCQQAFGTQSDSLCPNCGSKVEYTVPCIELFSSDRSKWSNFADGPPPLHPANVVIPWDNIRRNIPEEMRNHYIEWSNKTRPKPG